MDEKIQLGPRAQVTWVKGSSGGAKASDSGEINFRNMKHNFKQKEQNYMKRLDRFSFCLLESCMLNQKLNHLKFISSFMVL